MLGFFQQKFQLQSKIPEKLYHGTGCSVTCNTAGTNKMKQNRAKNGKLRKKLQARTWHRRYSSYFSACLQGEVVLKQSNHDKFLIAYTIR